MSTDDPKLQLLYPPHVQHNLGSLSTIKFLSSAFSGSVAGVLGLENYWGFALFGLSTAFTTGAMYLLQCKGQSPTRYLQGGWWEMVNPGQDNIFSFILFWTLFYGIVHVYD